MKYSIVASWINTATKIQAAAIRAALVAIATVTIFFAFLVLASG